ncbi:MAG: cupin domain-containing protein [Vulcanimicrobiaceae bacterium]
MNASGAGIMVRTSIDGIWMWSRWQPDRKMNFNSFYITGSEPMAIDPLACEDADIAQMQALGGVAWIVVTNRDHERASRDLARKLGARIAASALDAPLLSGPVDRELHEGDVIGDARVVSFEGLKTAGECALYFAELATVVMGDALWGDPPGSLRIMPDEKLADAKRAALSLRKIRALQPQHVLVGDGACVFGDASRVLDACFSTRTDVFAACVNVDELHMVYGKENTRPYRGGGSAEIGLLLGARKLGYRLAAIPQGTKWVPMHWHSAEEEIYVVLTGRPSVRTPSGEYDCRPGDIIAFPCGPSGAHTIRNQHEELCTVLMLANNDANDVCSYPDSQKVLVEARDLMLRDHPDLEYFDGEL